MNWHDRYRQQAEWTEQLRTYLFGKVGLSYSKRILDLGCGTGALLGNLETKAIIHGLDIYLPVLEQAKLFAPQARFCCGDGALLPYADATFDISFCHFVLLWVTNPAEVVRELRRVTRPGGYILAFAEPDYGGRIDYPTELEELGILQTQSLKDQGADPEMGRKLAGIFRDAGLKQVQTGILGGEWQDESRFENADLEWQVLLEDVGTIIPPDKLDNFRKSDNLARQQGSRVLYVPTFYAWGMV